MLFAFLAAVSYGGNLRAFLLSPEYPAPIDSIDDMVGSGKEWKMVVYQDNFEHLIAEKEPVLWNNKVPVGYNDFPFETVRSSNGVGFAFFGLKCVQFS